MRLNGEMRDEIRRFAMAKLEKGRHTFALLEQQLLVDCYHVVVSEAARKLIAQIEALSISGYKWFDYETTLTFNVAGQTVRLAQTHVPVEKQIRLASPYHCWSSPIGVITLGKHKALVERVRDWQGKIEQEKADFETAKKTLDLLLKGVSTVEKLKQYWPEGKEFFSSPPCQTRKASGVPAVQIEALNKMLGIKTEELVV